MKEGKGKDQINMPFFGKFILLSNHEKNFATIDEREIRFWVNKVPVFEKNNVNLLKEMVEEIPAFLYYLQKRKLVTKKEERHWFRSDLLRTKALEIIIDNSAPVIQKQLKLAIEELFYSTEYTTLQLPLEVIYKDVLKSKFDKVYVKDSLNKMGYKSSPITARFTYPKITEIYKDGKYFLEATSVSYNGRYYSFDKKDFVKEDLPQKLDLI